MNPRKGFTLIELLVAISIVALLSSIVIASIGSGRAKARDAKRAGDLIQLRNALELYRQDNGAYPSTGGMNNVYMEDGCINQSAGVGDSKTANWIPGLAPTYISELPHDPKPASVSCYMYASNGTGYMLTAWNTVETGPQKTRLFSRSGVRETSWNITDANYMCDQYYIGGYAVSDYTGYNINNDYYARSFTIDNTGCNWGGH